MDPVTDTTLRLDPVGGYLFVAVVAAVLLGLLWLGPDRSRTTGRQRMALTALRLLVIATIFLAMLRPERVVTEMKRRSATLVILVDQSRSMTVTDGLGGRSRWEELKEQLADALPAIDDIAEEVRVKVYGFDADLHAVPFDAGEGIELTAAPTGEMSAIGSALEDVLRREAGERLLGVILLSDGAQRAYAPRDANPQAAAEQLADLGYPLFTFTFGQPRGYGQTRDVAVKELLAGPTVFEKNQLDVTGSLQVDGFAGAEVLVELLYETSPGEMEVVARTRLQAAADGQQLPINLSYIPEKQGEYKVTLRAVPQEGESITNNNELSTFINVLGGGLRVLYLEGALRVEQRFLQESIDASANIDLDYVRIDVKTERGRDDMAQRFEPGKYDVFIIGDLDSTALKNDDWQRLVAAVEEGAGLIMLGGYHSFGPGGYRDTPLGNVLPIEMGQFERQRFEDPLRKDVHLAGPIQMLPAKQLGPSYSFMYLAAPQENAARWQELPALDGANRFDRIKPGGDVVAIGRTEDGRTWPLMVAGAWGKAAGGGAALSSGGRVLAFAADSTWRWVMEGHEDAHRKFWRQVILWLANVDETSNVWVRLDSRRYRPGGQVKFLVGADTPEGLPVTDATFDVEVLSPDGTRTPVRLARQGERMIGSFFETREPGDYAITVSATSGGEMLGSMRSRFLVYAQDLELDNPAADPDLMSNLAARTASAEPIAGRALAGEELPGLLNELAQRPPEMEIAVQYKYTYWDKWPVLAAFIALICAEWYLRKRWGLV